ncbi:hypothetical protein HZM62_004127 [Salmonella enterica]|nr:hypothetical protein [Salmonella enterica]
MNKFALNSVLVIFCACLNSVALGQWQEGDVTGEVNWTGTVTQFKNPWLWSQGNINERLHLSYDKAEKISGFYHWNELLSDSIVLLGKTNTLIPAGRPGILPVITYGDNGNENKIDWTSGGIVKITVKVHDDDLNSDGLLTFSIRVNSIMVSGVEGIRRGYSVYADSSELNNGFPTKSSVASFSDSLSQIKSVFANDLPSWFNDNISSGGSKSINDIMYFQNTAMGVIYSAQIVGKSGVLTFSESSVPKNWHFTLPINITYR